MDTGRAVQMLSNCPALVPEVGTGFGTALRVMHAYHKPHTGTGWVVMGIHVGQAFRSLAEALRCRSFRQALLYSWGRWPELMDRGQTLDAELAGCILLDCAGCMPLTDAPPASCHSTVRPSRAWHADPKRYL